MRKDKKIFWQDKRLVTYIQSKVLMIIQRGRYRRLKIATVFLQRALKKRLVFFRIQKLRRDTRLFHYIVKGRLIRKHTREVATAVRVLQRCAKKLVARFREANRILISVHLVQRVFRGYSVRDVNQGVRVFLRTKKIYRLEMKCATLLQAKFRLHLVKKRSIKVFAALDSLQVNYNVKSYRFIGL